MTNSTLTTIGKLLGGKDHSTILNGVKKISEEYEDNENTRNIIDTVKNKIINN